MQLDKLTNEVVRIVKQTGNYIKSRKDTLSGEQIETKSLHNYVTEVDKAAEKQLVENLGKLIEGSGFIAEENTSDKKGERYNWIIDPLDGTTNFIHGLYPFAVSVALQDGNELVVGVVYEIGLDECFYAWKNGGAYLNGKAIHVSTEPSVQHSLIATGFPYEDYRRMDQFMYSIRYFMENSRGLRRLGSAATDMAYVACGRFESFYEYGLQPWDVAGATVLVREAGGVVTDFEGGDNFLFGHEIIAANKAVFPEFLNAVQQCMNT